MKKFNSTKQTEELQSEIKCLSIISEFYGKKYTLEHLLELASRIDTEDTQTAITTVAGLLGFHTITGYLSIDKLSKVTLPCILLWNNSFYVVLHRIKRNRFYIVDPNAGKHKYKETDIVEHWINECACGRNKGFVIFIKPTAEFQKEINDTIVNNSFLKIIQKWILRLFK